MNVAVDRRPYPLSFVGDRSITTNLSWGQQWVWDALSNLPDGRHMCISIVQPIAGEMKMTPDRAANGVADLVNRFESLRTVCVDDAEASMGLRQSVLTTGAVPVELWTVPRFDQEASTLVSTELSRLDFDVHGLPFRAVILAENDTVRLVVIRMSHMVVDMWSAGLLRTELKHALGLVKPNDPARRASQDWQPVDQANFESGETGRRLSDRSLQFWQSQMGRFPTTLFSRPSAPPETPRFCEGKVSSKAGFDAVHTLSRRYGNCSPAVVLIAAVFALLGAWSGTATVGLPVIVSNRHMRRLQGLVAPLTEMSAVCVDVRGRSFEEIVRSTAHASLVAQRYGQYDIPRYLDLQTDLARAREGFEMSSYLNVRLWGETPPTPPDDEHGHQAILGLTERTVAAWNEGFESYNVKLGVLADLGDGAAHLTLRTDTSAIPRHDVSALLSSLDPVLIAALRVNDFDQAGVERIVGQALVGQ
ncbi:condensation domain-containing protein [Micromonospora sp. DT228]|uniref:condensation domain-containing protein n=1 Tax=Micromonospora sp. DT228 TaxID=3393443 RepID=UPI003CEE8BB1